jgi:hypothetical protein
MFSSQLTQAGHTRRFSIQHVPDDGWEVIEEADTRVIRHVQYHDWHRVERILADFSETVRSLEHQGWRPLAQ